MGDEVRTLRPVLLLFLLGARRCLLVGLWGRTTDPLKVVSFSTGAALYQDGHFMWRPGLNSRPQLRQGVLVGGRRDLELRHCVQTAATGSLFTPEEDCAFSAELAVSSERIALTERKFH